ncbi:MAG: hypothetical protein IT223_06945 [Crocinitomicaceae bacterium]|nr:hypothetical protein [Crocinitomicaceae bacterium]
MKNLLLILCFFQCTTSAVCQLTLESVEGNHPLAISTKKHYQDPVWTIAGNKILDSKYKKWKFDFALDARQTLMGNTRARLAGLRVGIEYRRVHRFGIGYYNLGDGVWVSDISSVDPQIDSAFLRFSYGSVFYERVLLFTTKIEWSITANTGTAIISGEYRSPLTKENVRFERRVKPTEVSTTCYFHLTYFISIGAGLGYRHIQNAPPELQPVYSSPIAILRVRIKLIKMVRGFFNADVRQAY